MEIKYQFFEEEHLLIQKFTGLFSLEGYIKYNSQISKDNPSKTINKVLIDFRDLVFNQNNDVIPDDFNEKLERISEIRKNINQKQHQNKEITLVIWVDKPLPTVIAHLFVNNFSKMNYNYCSTSSKAIEILKIPWQFNYLENIVNRLKNSFKNN
jgi:hypothetical protein